MSASGPGDRVASSGDVAIYFREDCRTLRDSLQLEMVVAQYWLQIRDVVTTAGVPMGEAVGAGVVQELEREGDALSHAVLRGLAQLAAGETARRAADAVARLGERGVGLPPHFADVGESMATGAWRARGGLGGEYTLFAEFAHPHGGRHSIALYVPRREAPIKHIGLIGAMSRLDGDGPFHPSALEPIAIGVAGELLRELLERSYGADAADSDDFRVPIAVARARAMVLDDGDKRPRPPIRPAAAESRRGRSRRSPG